MKESKNILFTFDYELFLGARSGSVQKCMLEPTQELLSIFDRYSIQQAIFFVDSTYLCRLKEMAQIHTAAKEDYNSIVKQVQEIIRKGHYVFPHLHPHWLDAIYSADKNSWQLTELRKYRFHALSEKERAEVMDSSIQILKEIILPVNPHYKLDGYRAGGWCIQPFGDFHPHFKKHEITTDFSVLKGMKNLSTAQYYDFESAPDKSVYKFEENPALENKEGSFTEVAISVLEIPRFTQLMNKFWLKYLWKTGQRSWGDGNGVVAAKTEYSEAQKSNQEMVSLELINSIKLPLYKNYLKKNKLMHFISHPKMLSKHNLKSLALFLKFATSRYHIQCDFRKLPE